MGKSVAVGRWISRKGKEQEEISAEEKGRS